MDRFERITIDGNEAAALVAHKLSEVIAIYPITPSSTMGELADEWSAKGRTNLWGAIPKVVEMQSEAGAAGTIHGAVQGGALATTFTASQGLLLMIPNMYKLAGELSPVVFHVAARTLATHALSIFGDHSDVYACRGTGFAMLCAGNVQEAHDFAAISHAATLESRIPFLHFFDGFRTSHEVAKIEEIPDEILRDLVSEADIREHKRRALDPDHPVLRGTAQNPDTFFQAREAASPWFARCPAVVAETMARFGAETGRRYNLFDYVGHPAAERVIVMMGSGAEAVHELVDHLVAKGEKVGLLKVRLYRPFAMTAFVEALPPTVRQIAVLDRTKEPGATADPLHLDVLAALVETWGNRSLLPVPNVVGGRYGLSSKEFTPAMALGVFEELAKEKPRRRFTLGIVDDVSGSSLDWDREFDLEPDDVFRGVFYGLGSDGTVGANKNSIKIIGEGTDLFAQGYFVYDSKKSGSVTVSHLRFGPRPIRSTYLVGTAKFVACHQSHFLERMDVLERAGLRATLLVNSPYPAADLWHRIPRETQETILDRDIRVFTIDADAIAKESGLGRRINTVMQAAFFAISGVLPREEARKAIEGAIEKSYGKKNPEIVEKNFKAVAAAFELLTEMPRPVDPSAEHHRAPIVAPGTPEAIVRLHGKILEGKGDLLPVSAFPPDGTWQTGTAKWEKRNLALEIPAWDAELCIQCNKCVFVCPHAAIRVKTYAEPLLAGAPGTFLHTKYKGPEFPGELYTIQVAPEDCTGCTLCVHVCPAKEKTRPGHKALDMVPQPPLRESEARNFDFFLTLPEVDRTKVKGHEVKGSQFLEPLFEFSGACVGCGETPYVKLLTQLFGDRLMVANATGCSSIYGGNLPTTPYTTDPCGRGPAWSNSLFEDNAEFGLGLRLAADHETQEAVALLRKIADRLAPSFVAEILANVDGRAEHEVVQQRERVQKLRALLSQLPGGDVRRLESVAERLVRKSVWIVGGDGWAYDIGTGGLDHVLALGADVNILVLDTGVYSNTGGQASKATPLGAIAKFAASGKATARKDLGLMAMTYGNVYVAQVAFGAKDSQTVRAMYEAETWRGPSLVLAGAPCIAHGFEMGEGLDHQKMSVDSGLWPLYRFDPRRLDTGQNPLLLDSPTPKIPFEQYARTESRFRMLETQDPARAKELFAFAEKQIRERYELYELLSKRGVPAVPAGA